MTFNIGLPTVTVRPGMPIHTMVWIVRNKSAISQPYASAVQAAEALAETYPDLTFFGAYATDGKGNEYRFFGYKSALATSQPPKFFPFP
jgi:hypothetical protein